MKTKTFEVRRLFFLYARGDAARVRPVLLRLAPYDGFIWTSSWMVSQRAGINDVLARGSEWMTNDWLIGCQTERAKNTIWLKELQTGTATGIVGLNRRAVVGVRDPGVAAVADLGPCLTGRHRQARSAGPHRVRPAVPAGDVPHIDADCSVDVLIHRLLRTVLSAEEFKESLAECYRDACRIMDDIRRRESIWQKIASLRAAVHQAIRDRYIYEKIENDEAPDQSGELGPWRRLDYIRHSSGLPFTNGVFRMMETHHDTLWFAGDIERTLANRVDRVDELIGGLESLRDDLKMLCLCST